MIREYIKTAIWYAIVLTVMFAVYYVGSTYTLLIVDDDFVWMEPIIEPKSTHFVMRGDEVIKQLKTNDIVAYWAVRDNQIKRMLGRVLAAPGETISARNNKLLVNGLEAGELPDGMQLVETGIIVPRECVFVIFDSPRARNLALDKHLVPYRDIYGRLMQE